MHHKLIQESLEGYEKLCIFNLSSCHFQDENWGLSSMYGWLKFLVVYSMTHNLNHRKKTPRIQCAHDRCTQLAKIPKITREIPQM